MDSGKKNGNWLKDTDLNLPVLATECCLCKSYFDLIFKINLTVSIELKYHCLYIVPRSRMNQRHWERRIEMDVILNVYGML